MTRAEIIDEWKAANGYDDLLNAYSDMQKALAVLADAISNGEDLHTESCPEDDTCVCRLVSVINAALAGSKISSASGIPPNPKGDKRQ